MYKRNSNLDAYPKDSMTICWKSLDPVREKGDKVKKQKKKRLKSIRRASKSFKKGHS